MLHIINYFARYSQANSTSITNSKNTIVCLTRLFQHFSYSIVFYCDWSHYFFSKEMKFYLNLLNIKLILSLLNTFKSINLIERNNQILKKVIIKESYK